MPIEIPSLRLGLPHLPLLFAVIIHHPPHQIECLLILNHSALVDLVVLVVGLRLSSGLVQGYFVLRCGEELGQVLLGVEEFHRRHLEGG